MRKSLLKLAVAALACACTMTASAQSLSGGFSGRGVQFSGNTVPASSVVKPEIIYDDAPASRANLYTDLQFTSIECEPSPMVRGRENKMTVKVTNTGNGDFSGVLMVTFTIKEFEGGGFLPWQGYLNDGKELSIPKGESYTETITSTFDNVPAENCGEKNLALRIKVMTSETSYSMYYVTGTPSEHKITIEAGALAPQDIPLQFTSVACDPSPMVRGRKNTMTVTVTNPSKSDFNAPVAFAFLQQSNMYWLQYINNGNPVMIEAGKSVTGTIVTDFADLEREDCKKQELQCWILNQEENRFYQAAGTPSSQDIDIQYGELSELTKVVLAVDSVITSPTPLVRGFQNIMKIVIANEGDIDFDNPIAMSYTGKNGQTTFIDLNDGKAVKIAAGEKAEITYTSTFDSFSDEDLGIVLFNFSIPDADGYYHFFTGHYSGWGCPLYGAVKVGDLGFVTINGECAVAIADSFEGGAIPATVTIDGTDYPVTCILERAFAGNDKITSVIIPSSVTEIEANAFADCPALTSVTFEAADGSRADDSEAPALTIYGGAFGGETALTEVRCNHAVPPTCAADAFSEATCADGLLIVPDGSVEAYKEAAGWSRFGHITDPATLGISAAGADAVSGDNRVYDLSGRRLNGLHRGINIVGGRKILVVE